MLLVHHRILGTCQLRIVEIVDILLFNQVVSLHVTLV